MISEDVDGFWVLESLAGERVSEAVPGTVRVTDESGRFAVYPLTPAVLHARDESQATALRFMREDGRFETTVISVPHGGTADVVIQPRQW